MRRLASNAAPLAHGFKGGTNSRKRFTRRIPREVRDVKGEMKGAKKEEREGTEEMPRLNNSGVARDKENSNAPEASVERGLKEVEVEEKEAKEAEKGASKRADISAGELELASKEATRGNEALRRRRF